MTKTLRAAALSIAGGVGLAVLGVLAGPAGPASAAPVGIDLYAAGGTTNLPGAGGAGMPVLGYCTASPCTVTAPGGPTLRVAQGSVVTITLHNELAGEATSLYVGGQPMPPDTAAVAAGGTHTYAFTATRAGTYLYEAGITTGGEHQVARGLYGAFVVDPVDAGGAVVPGQAYADASTSYAVDQVLVLGEIDPALSRSTNPAAFDMRAFAPKWTTVNGKASPGTAPIAAASGQKALLRWVNAGAGYHSMAVLGADQRLVAFDGSRLVNGTVDISRRYVAETFGPGQTADAIVTVPATATNRSLAVYDASLSLHDNTTPGLGGMLTTIDVAADTALTDVPGPATRAVTYDPATRTVTATLAANTASAPTAAELRVDSVGAAPTAMTVGSGGTSATYTGPTTGGPLAALAAGQHVVYVRSADGNGVWGPYSSVLVQGSDGTGPTTSGVTLTPDHGNGSAAVTVHATANDTASGNSAIAGAELAVDGGAASAMTLESTGPVAGVVGSVPAATVAGLTEGTHEVTVRSRDAAGNWGATASATLVADRTGPTAGAVTVTPSPNNGTMTVNSTSASVRVSTTLTDAPPAGGDPTAVSPLVAGRGYLDGGSSAIPLEASDGAWSGTQENVYLDIPIATVKQLSEGGHPITVQGKDAAGNWGALSTGTLVIDRTGPVISGLALSPNPTNGAAQATLTGTATDPSGVARVEWFIGTDPGVGAANAATLGTGGGFTATIPLPQYLEGDYTVVVRGIDTLGNRSATNGTVVLHVVPRLWFSTSGNANPPGVGGTADDADIYHWTGARFGRTIDASASPYTLPASGGSNVNVDGFSRVDATHFYLSFAGSVTLPGITNGAVQDEDVVFWNANHWELFYDGSARGTMTANVDAISVVGSGMYFSLSTTTVPNGAGGSGDDADVYYWAGGTSSTYTRVVDATSTPGFSTNANQTPNVDGFVWRSATDWLMSFSTDTTITGLAGTVYDEDVVRRTGSTWSKYFNGNAAGLTNNNQDVDAFDIP